MKTDVLLVAVLSVVALSPWLGRVTRLPVPTVQFVCGCLLAIVPAAGLVNVSPELILLVVLPLILFWEGYQTSVAWAERYWRPIVLNGVLLVIVTAGTVAAIAHAFGFAWPAAWALGAVLAPTDASAVAAFGRKLPTSWMTALRGESLINDGTALVVLAVALDAAGHKHPGIGSIALRGTQSYGVGIAVGLAVTAVMLLLLPQVTDPMVNATFAIALPLLAAVPAEALGGSGVVAVVTCGIAGSRSARRISSARMRLPIHAFWQITTFVLSGGLFVLTGVLARRLVTGTSAAHAGALLLEGIAIFVAVLTVRLAWISVWTVLLRTFDRRPQQREIRVPSRARLVTVWGGLRGGISLAAALTIPASIGGTPFDHRADVLVLTFVVVALSLLVQGSTLGRLVQWASPAFPPPPTSSAVADARQALAQRTLHALDDGNFLADADSALRTEIHAHLETEASGANIDDPRDLDRMRLQLAVLERKRHELIGLVADRHVEDSVMWDLQHLLDREESRLEARLSTAELSSSGSMSGASHGPAAP